VVRNEYLEANPGAVSILLQEYKDSIDYANANPEAAGAMAEQLDLMKAAVAQKAIPNCNMVFIDGADMKTALDGFYQVLFNAEPKSWEEHYRMKLSTTSPDKKRTWPAKVLVALIWLMIWQALSLLVGQEILMVSLCGRASACCSYW
jgi:hypothetical protein